MQFSIFNQLSMTQSPNKTENQKILTYSQNSLVRRPMGLNHILRSRTSRVSDDDQSHLASASSRLRTLYFRVSNNKNNPSITEEAVFGPILSDVASSDTRHQYITSTNPVKISLSAIKCVGKNIPRLQSGAVAYKAY